MIMAVDCAAGAGFQDAETLHSLLLDFFLGPWGGSPMPPTSIRSTAVAIPEGLGRASILGGSSPLPSGHGCGGYSGGFCRPIPKRPLGNIHRGASDQCAIAQLSWFADY